MSHAVIRVSGKQFFVKEGDIISVDQPTDKAEILLLATDDGVKIGTPLVEGAVAKLEVVKSGLGDKIRVTKFKAKSRYRRVMGFRPRVTTLKITKISVKK